MRTGIEHRQGFTNMSETDLGPSPVRKHILVDGIETSYLEAGSGDPVVLLHGGEFGGDAEVCWEHTIPALARHYRVIAPDLLGFGQTAKIVDFVDGRQRRIRHFARFMDVVGAAGAPCIGNSMGGMLLLYDAGCEQPLIKPARLVSISGGGALSQSEHVAALFDYDGSTDGMKRVVAALFHGEQWPNDVQYVARRRANSLMPGAWEAIAAARFKRPEAVQEPAPKSTINYAGITVPSLIIAGSDDKIKPYGWWEELTSQMAQARSVVIPDAGHCSQIEQPAAVLRELLDFLAE